MGIYLVKKTKFQTKLGAHKQPSQPTETVLQDGLIVRTLWYKYKPFSHGAESAHPNFIQDATFSERKHWDVVLHPTRREDKDRK